MVGAYMLFIACGGVKPTGEIFIVFLMCMGCRKSEALERASELKSFLELLTLQYLEGEAKGIER
jgi:hypothetical protein